MKAHNLFKMAFVSGAMILGSCSSDDDNGSSVPSFDEPVNYVFERDGKSTVDFGGQTTRIAMAEEIIDAFKVKTTEEAALLAMYAHEKGKNDFSDPALNASDKSVKSKTAASTDYFADNAPVSAEIKAEFDSWISGQVTEVFPNWEVTAEAGKAGVIQEAGGGKNRYVNAKGLEYDQAFAKSLIGGLMLDQAINNYLGTNVLDAGTNKEDNDNGVVKEGKTYTNMEHKWDEAYGYLYGASADKTKPNETIGDADSFLNKYVGRVEKDTDFAGIAETIFNAFKKGRAAIVAKQYSVRDEQADIVKENLSKVIGVRAVYYLQQGKNGLGAASVDYGSVFHDLSEGYGFVYSLQFTQDPTTNKPYFSRDEVKGLLNDLMGGTNGLWTVTPATLDKMSETIAAKFGFTVAQAGS
ncbi:DUF4856 domain-containing protein [Aquimarina sp. TRL1]|uniref:DUF4856 domain-containing protein n=1 Tax=Aquimarina sp. (strain TRL1) TaxID=2736252 RepID=UPI00158D7C8B|nr:DUF4856 domain-containing protein [Aquimarina sp. TRL1]QKX05766.1 DUF4856 domain-containing protein [Aquimarina sp. TRL1]